MSLADPIASNYTHPFSADPYTGITPDELQRRRRLAQTMIQQGTDMSPTTGAGQYGLIVAIARAIQAGIGAYENDAATKEASAAQAAGLREGLSAITSGGWAAPTPTTSGPATRQPVANENTPAPPRGVTVDNV